jgi:hypothetical protein
MYNFNNINNSKITMSNVCISDGVVVNGRHITVNGETFEIPHYIKGNNQSIIDGKIFIDGYEFKDGKFKRTLKALWHMCF